MKKYQCEYDGNGIWWYKKLKTSITELFEKDYTLTDFMEGRVKRRYEVWNYSFKDKNYHKKCWVFEKSFNTLEEAKDFIIKTK